MDKQMYIGPNRPFDLPLASRAVFCADPQDTIPGLREKIAAYPVLKTLFVPLAQVTSARAQMGTAGTPLQKAYEQVYNASRKAREAQ